MNFTYLAQPPKRWTFEQPKLKAWVEEWCGDSSTLNLFAGKTKLDLNEMRVDVSPEHGPHYVSDCREFVKLWRNADGPKNRGWLFDAVILDPPYTWRKAKEKYGGRMIGQYPRLKNELLDILTKDARVISLGWDTVGMSKSRGFEKIAVCVVCHGGDHRDTLGLVEKRK